MEARTYVYERCSSRRRWRLPVGGGGGSGGGGDSGGGGSGGVTGGVTGGGRGSSGVSGVAGKSNRCECVIVPSGGNNPLEGGNISDGAGAQITGRRWNQPIREMMQVLDHAGSLRMDSTEQPA